MGAGLLGKEAMARSCLGARTLDRNPEGVEMDTRTLEIEFPVLP